MAELPRRTATYGSGFPLTRATRFQSWRFQRQRERHAREIAQAVRQKPFRVYGLPVAWEGRRALSGSRYGKKPLRLYGVRLAHRLREGAKPVTVYVNTSLVESSAVAEAKEEMEYALELRRDPDDPPGELEWMRMRIPVDGTPTEFEVIAGKGDGWGAVAAVGDVVVSVEVRNFAMADVVLETVADVEPYLVAPQPR